ncbi:MAG TPA: HD domain-containing phosphohydrolase [bacterium]|nr:HD domain-containing phosphohydrolase [bacterium]
MTRAAGAYFLFLRFLGLILTISVAIFATNQGIGAEIGLLLLLGIVASWLRFDLPPIGYVALTPLVSFVGVLLYPPFVALLITSISAIVGARLFGHKGWNSVLEEAGEEASSMLLSLTIYQLTKDIALDAAFAAAVTGYALGRIIFTAIHGKLLEDISFGSTVTVSGKYLFANILILAMVAFGATRTTPLYNRFGILGLSLVVIALIEFYRPWKLLSQQARDLYASLAIIAEAIDIKDPYTGRHSRRVAEIATKLARRLELPEREVNTVRVGALLHDIGKIGVSGNIIRKPSSLESREVRAMQRHPVISADIMEPVEYFRDAARLVRHHHEHYDGTGYPDGLKADDIPVGSRIILVADAFDAMTTDRPYRRGRAKEEALRILLEQSGRQFDGRVVKALQKLVG